LRFLKEGNERYLKSKLVSKKAYNKKDRELFDKVQLPFAVILTCSDSRVAPEIFFDLKMGDIFTIRNAGNIVDKTVLGGIEYATGSVNCKLVVVCGHSNCGAVIAACSGAQLPPNINHIAEHIKPSMKDGCEVDHVIRNHINTMIEQIKADEIVKNLGVKVVGAYYDMYSGVVEWF